MFFATVWQVQELARETCDLTSKWMTLSSSILRIVSGLSVFSSHFVYLDLAGFRQSLLT